MDKYSDHELKIIGKHIVTKKPEILSEIKESGVLTNPDPVLDYKFDLYPLRELFLQRMNITLEVLQKHTSYRRLFIAVCIKLYYPAFITGYRQDIMDGLAHEISRALNCRRDWISQQHDYIISFFSKRQQDENVYGADKKLIENFASTISNDTFIKVVGQSSAPDLFSNGNEDVSY